MIRKIQLLKYAHGNLNKIQILEFMVRNILNENTRIKFFMEKGCGYFILGHWVLTLTRGEPSGF